MSSISSEVAASCAEVSRQQRHFRLFGHQCSGARARFERQAPENCEESFGKKTEDHRMEKGSFGILLQTATQKTIKKKNAARDKQRRPKSMKTSQSRVGITFKASQSAYNSLLKSQWVWKEKQCACGQAFDTVPWKTCMRRGFGRLFVRCYTCGCYSAFFQM